MDATTTAVRALTEHGVLGPWLHDREPLTADEALEVVHVLTAAGVPPTAEPHP